MEVAEVGKKVLKMGSRGEEETGIRVRRLDRETEVQV